MATNFPSSLDSFTDPVSSDKLDSPDHAGQHTDKNDAIEAMQTKVGIDSSAVVTSIDYLLKNAASEDPGHVHTVYRLKGTGNVVTGSSTGESSHTDDLLWTEKLSVSITPAVAGDYNIQFFCQLASTADNRIMGVRLQLDNTTTLIDNQAFTCGIYGDGHWEVKGGTIFSTLTAAAHTIDMDYQTSADTGKTVYIKDAYIVITRLT